MLPMLQRHCKGTKRYDSICYNTFKTRMEKKACRFTASRKLVKREFCQPVLTMLFLILTLWELLMWIPSVLGLEAGAITSRWDALTWLQVVNAMCICWLFINLRLCTFKFLHLWNVMACSIIVNNMKPMAIPLERERRIQYWKRQMEQQNEALTVGARW